jgi:hypothetical protein
MPDLAFRCEFLAEFVEDAAAVFTWDVVQGAIDPAIAETPVPGHQYALGYDPARYSDRSGLAIIERSTMPMQCVRVLDVAGGQQPSYLLQAQQVAELARAYYGARVLVDGTGHDQLVDELVRLGARAERFKFTAESKRELIDGLVLALESGRLRIPDDARLARELLYYSYAIGAGGSVKLGAPAGPGHYDDFVTALALAVSGARAPGTVSGPGRYVSGPPRCLPNAVDPRWRPEYLPFRDVITCEVSDDSDR